LPTEKEVFESINVYGSWEVLYISFVKINQHDKRVLHLALLCCGGRGVKKANQKDTKEP